MKEVRITNRFKRDVRRALKRGKDRNKLERVVATLQSGKTLPEANRPQKLVGDWQGFWECHIEPDWLLIYDVTDTEVLLAGTGTHADLFR